MRVASSLADKDGSKFTLVVSASDGREEPSTTAIVDVSVFYKHSAQLVRHRGLHFVSNLIVSVFVGVSVFVLR